MSEFDWDRFQKIWDEARVEVGKSNQAMLDNLNLALEAKDKKDWHKVIELLTPSVEPPSIYHGHYRELFIAYRAVYREDMKLGKFKKVVEIIERMKRLDKEMLETMTSYWSEQNKENYAPNHFQSYSKINATDLKTYNKALVKAAWAK